MFVAEFHQGEPPVPVGAEDIRRIERELSTVLPQAYATFMESHGPVRTPSLLSLIVDGQHEQRDVMAFFTPVEVVQDTQRYWSGGMSEEMVGFASDSMGNLFGFRRRVPGDSQPDDAEVWFFDHDFCKDSKVADSFDGWILSYLKLKETGDHAPAEAQPCWSPVYASLGTLTSTM